MAFPGADQINVHNMLDERARIFTVTDHRYIHITGERIVQIEKITIDGVDLPFSSMRNFTKQEPGKEPEIIPSPVPMVQISDVPGIGQCVFRSQWSNDGQWQIGSQVCIWAEWAEADGETFVSSIDVDEAVAEKDAEIAALKAKLEEADETLKARAAELKKANAALAKASKVGKKSDPKNPNPPTE